MTMTTIKVPKATRDRLQRLAAADGVTLAQEIDKLVRERAPRPRPATGGFRGGRPLTAEETDDQLAAGNRNSDDSNYIGIADAADMVLADLGQLDLATSDLAN